MLPFPALSPCNKEKRPAFSPRNRLIDPEVGIHDASPLNSRPRDGGAPGENRFIFCYFFKAGVHAASTSPPPPPAPPRSSSATARIPKTEGFACYFKSEMALFVCLQRHRGGEPWICYLRPHPPQHLDSGGTEGSVTREGALPRKQVFKDRLGSLSRKQV